MSDYIDTLLQTHSWFANRNAAKASEHAQTKDAYDNATDSREHKAAARHAAGAHRATWGDETVSAAGYADAGKRRYVGAHAAGAHKAGKGDETTSAAGYPDAGKRRYRGQRIAE